MQPAEPNHSKSLDQYREYLRLVARLELGVKLRGKLDPSDIVQETMLDAWKDRDKYRGSTDAEYCAWLRRILMRNLHDAIRDLQRKKRDVSREQSLYAAMEQSASRLELQLAAEQTSPSQALERSEDLRRLADALAELPEDQRTAVELHHLHGCSSAEIAEILGRGPPSGGRSPAPRAGEAARKVAGPQRCLESIRQWARFGRK